MALHEETTKDASGGTMVHVRNFDFQVQVHECRAGADVDQCMIAHVALVICCWSMCKLYFIAQKSCMTAIPINYTFKPLSNRKTFDLFEAHEQENVSTTVSRMSHVTSAADAWRATNCKPVDVAMSKRERRPVG